MEMVWNPGSAREMGRGGMRNAWRVDIARPTDCLNNLLTHFLFKKRKEGRKEERKGGRKKGKEKKRKVSCVLQFHKDLVHEGGDSVVEGEAVYGSKSIALMPYIMIGKKL